MGSKVHLSQKNKLKTIAANTDFISPRGINILDIRKALQTPEHSTERQQQSSLLVCSEFIIIVTTIISQG